MPWLPAAPSRPAAPAAPAAPTAPAIPWMPWLPAGPAAPDPAGPAGPLLPFSPSTPSAPAGPTGPSRFHTIARSPESQRRSMRMTPVCRSTHAWIAPRPDDDAIAAVATSDPATNVMTANPTFRSALDPRPFDATGSSLVHPKRTGKAEDRAYARSWVRQEYRESASPREGVRSNARRMLVRCARTPVGSGRNRSLARASPASPDDYGNATRSDQGRGLTRSDRSGFPWCGDRVMPRRPWRRVAASSAGRTGARRPPARP
jgi:hypothetical protein